MSSTESTVSWNPPSVPIRHQADVIVIGGGPGGLGAAVIAARAGADVLLIERYGALGGMASFGEIHPFMRNHCEGIPMDAPVYIDWLDRIQEYLPPAEQKVNSERGKLQVDKDVAMLAAEDLCLEAGVRLLYHHTLADVIVKDRLIDAVILQSKSGFTAAKAKMYIDCSGDADLAFRAGNATERGGPSGHAQPMTLCFKLGGIDRSVSGMEMRKKLTEIFTEAKESGEIKQVRENVLVFDWLEPDVLHFNTTRIIHKKGEDAVELSEAEIEGRRQLRELLNLFRKKAPGFANARVYSIAHHVGVRESRRVIGLQYLTRDAFVNRQKFPDAIARINYPIDIHNPNGTGTELIHMTDKEWYEVPYGCVVARDRDNLLVGGRPISVDHALHSSSRVMPPAVSVGQGAGMGAALAVAKNCLAKEVDGKEVRAKLNDLGAVLG